MGAETWIAIGKFIGAVFGFTAAPTGWAWAVNVARLALLAVASKALAPRPDLSQAAREKTTTVRDTIHPQRFMYGEDMLSGPIIFAQVNGDENQYLTMAVELLGHEVDGIVSYRLDDENIALTDITAGTVTNGRFDGVAEVNFLRGTATQTCPALLDGNFSNLFGNLTHRGLNHSYMVWRFTLEKDNDAFEAGAPQALRAIVRGRKLYDPRLDDTNGGIGPHRLADPATWEWSDNPALCLADFMRDEKFGMKERDDRIDWPLVITAANICDESVSVPSGTQNRYTCNATFESTEKRGDVRDAILASMLGRMVFSQGKWRMWAGAAITPDVTLDETNLAGQVAVQASAGAKERYNRVRGKYIDPSRNYTASTYPEIRSTAYETADGGEVRPLVLDALATNNSFEAQRKGIIALRQSRQQRIVSFQGNYSCFKLQPGTVVSLDLDEYGFNGETFFISEWKMGDEFIELTLVEEDELSWADPLLAQYVSRSATGTLQFGQLGASPPTNVSVAAAVGGVVLTWTRPATITATEIWASDDNDRANATLVATVLGEQYFDQISDGRTRYYWLRGVNDIGIRSQWEPNLTTTTYSSAAVLNENIATVPDFQPGFVGGQSDFRYTLNAITGGASNDGEIRIQGSEFDHPDGTTITPNATDFHISSFYELAVIGRFFVMYSATVAETRFGGVAADWGGGSPDDTRFITVTWDSVNGWRARNNSGTYYAFTPLVTDCIIAIGTKLSTTGGIDSLIVLTSGTPGAPGADGSDGADGNSVYAASIYRRAVSQPTTPTGGSYNFATQTLSPPSGWSVSPPSSDGNPLWVSTAIAEAAPGGTDNTLTWSTPAELVSDGADGAQGPPGTDGVDGNSVYYATVFRRDSVLPGTPTGGSYNFATQTLTPPTNWSATPPANDGNPLYVSSAVAEAPVGGTDSTLSWSSPQELVSDGADGADGSQGPPGADGVDGLSVYYAQIFRRSASAPSTPTGGQYNFTLGLLTPPAGWSNAPPASDGNPMYVCTAVAEIQGTTGIDTTLTWSTPAELVSDGADGAAGAPGSPGADGNSVYYAQIFRRDSVVPAAPTGGQYNFATQTLTPPGGWSVTPPQANGFPLYVSTGIAEALPGGTDTSITWSTPNTLVSDGTQGSAALNIGWQMNSLDNWFRAYTAAGQGPLQGLADFSIVDDTSPIGTERALQNEDNADDGDDFYSELMPVDPARRYRVSLYARQPVGDRNNYLLVTFFDANGDIINNTSTPVSDATGWSIGTHHYWGVINGDFPTAWTKYERSFGAGETHSIPSNAVTMRIGALVTRTGTVNTQVRFADYRVVELNLDGADGNSVYYAQIFRRSASPPSTPSGGQYNFGTQVLTPPSGWSTAPPASDGNPLYVCTAVAEVNGTTGIDTSLSWSSPQELVSDGADGATGPPGSDGGDGNSTYVASVYLRARLAPSTPTGGSYNFGTATLTPPSGWSEAAPADDGNSLWVSVGRFEINGITGIDSTVTWTVPVRLTSAVYTEQVLTTRDWQVVDPFAQLDGGIWTQYNGSVNNMAIVNNEVGPFGDYPLMLQVRGDGVSNPGWYGGLRGNFAYDPDRSYVIYCWVRRRGNASFPAGGLYIGPMNTGGGSEFVKSMAGTPNSNPYHIPNQGAAVMDLDVWYLAAMHIWADGALSADQGLTGLYDPRTGEQVFNGTEFQWNGLQNNGVAGMRFAFYDNAAPPVATDQGFDYCRITAWTIDGQEPSIQAVLGQGAVQGDFVDVKYQRSTTQPATPTGANPSGWFDDIPGGTDTVWQTSARKDALGNLIGVWSTPAAIQGLTYRGAYSAVVAYIPNDVVTFQERSYVCTLATTGNAPSGTNSGNAQWDLLAGKGDPGDPPSSFTDTITVPSGGPQNLRALADAAGYDGISDTVITFNFNTGTITGNANGGNGIETGSWPATATHDLTLNVGGTVIGGGGRGGDGGNGLGGNKDGDDGGSGGDAIWCEEDIDINVNVGGVVRCGSGGGGGGGGGSNGIAEPLDYGGGGGGGGYPNGSGGSGGTGLGGAAGNPGTTGGGGSGGSGGLYAGDGGNGGNINLNGSVGGNGTGNNGPQGGGGSGGSKGYAVRYNANTVIVTNNGGTIQGVTG